MDAHPARRFGAIALLAAGIAGVAAPAAPAQEPPGQEASIRSVESDAQLTVFKIAVNCSSPVPATSACSLGVRLSWRQTDRRTWKESGEVRDLGTVPAVVPVGTQTVEVKVAPAKLRDVTASRNVAASITAALVDPAGTVLDSSSVFRRGGAWADHCGGPSFVAFTGGTAEEIESNGGKDTRGQILTGELPSDNYFVVGSKPISFEMVGVKYTAAPGSKLKLYCAAITSVKGGRAFPAVFLDKGTMRVAGKPRGRGYAANVTTYEGALGSRVQEAVDFTVVRSAPRKISTIKVSKGRTTAITPWNSRTRSPCTSGDSLRVDRGGRITKV